jgi:integrase
VDAGGTWRTKTIQAKNLTEARRRREELNVRVRAGEEPVASRVKLEAVAEDFFATFESLVFAGEKSQRTLDLYRQRWRTHLERPLGRLNVQTLRPEHVARVLQDLRRAGLSPWTTKGVWTLLSSILSHAQTRGLIVESPLRRVSKAERPTGKAKTKPRTLTDSECAQLVSNTSERWRTMAAVAVGTGLRLSELLGLRWQDIDFDQAEIRVRFQLSVAKRDRPARLVTLKTEAAERDVYLVPELATLLKAHKAQAFAEGHAKADDLVYATHDGKPLSQRNATRALRLAGDAAGLNPVGVPPVSWHDLRHTAISRLIAAGLDVVQVQRQAGHSRPSVTLDIYSHEFQRANRSDDVRAKIVASGISVALGSAGAASTKRPL